MRFLTRKLVKPKDLNANNTLFGGRCLEWVDEEAAIYAAIETRHPRVVTKSISFRLPKSFHKHRHYEACSR